MTKRRLYVATSNAGKLRDFAVAAASVAAAWTIATLPGLSAIAPSPEDGATFYENACAKALYYAQHAPGAIVLADDSGLAVDALDGAPGVYSARFADRQHYYGAATASQDERNNLCLLAELGRLHLNAAPSAHYRCVLAAARDGAVLSTAEGSVSGEIMTAPRGSGGFGYDPLFLLPHLGRTMAELDPETRLSLSHRGAALRLLLPQLEALL